MMPYVCFSNYLYKNINSNGDNIWFEYAKKYGTKDCDYVKNKLSKSFQTANKVLDEGLVSIEKAKELFEDGFSFERYFIEKAMCGELAKKIKPVITKRDSDSDDLEESKQNSSISSENIKSESSKNKSKKKEFV